MTAGENLRLQQRSQGADNCGRAPERKPRRLLKVLVAFTRLTGPYIARSQTSESTAIAGTLVCRE
jgi:hypothetical protein